MRVGIGHRLPRWDRGEGSLIAPDIDTAVLGDAVRRIAARLASVAELGRRTSDGTDSQIVFDEAVALVGAELDADSAEVFILDHAAQRLVRRAGWGLGKALLGRSTELGAELSHVGGVLATESSVVVEDFRLEPRFKAGSNLMDDQMLSGVGALIRDGVPEGVIAVHSRKAGHFPHYASSYLEIVANIIGGALNRDHVDSDLRASEDQFRVLFEAAPVGIAVANAAGMLVQVNESLVRMLDRPKPDILGRGFIDFVHPEDIAVASKNRQAVLDGEVVSVRYEYRLVQGSGRVIWVDLAVKSEITDSGALKMYQLVLTDITERKLGELAAKENSARLANIIANSPVVFFEADGEGRITFVEGQQTNGLDGATLVGVALVGPEINPALREMMIAALQGMPAAGEVPIPRLGKDFHCVMTPIFGPSGKVERVLGVAHDTTDRRAATAARQESDAQARFLANMSHELRTPLNSILGFSQLLSNGTAGTLNEKQLRYAGHIASSGHHLLELINDVLDISKVKAGKVDLKFEAVSIDATVRETLEAFAPAATAARVLLEAGPLEGLYALADRRSLTQILINLLSNALKFTPEGGSVTIRGRSDGGRVMVDVSDSGIGIDVGNQELVFDEFKQVVDDRTKVRGGTGLGLPLSRRLAGLMGGTVTVRSRIGAGSTFTLDLPLAAAPA